MTLKGVAEWALAVKGIADSVDRAVQMSVSQGARAEKIGVQAQISGAPRWVGHENHPRSGGPGVLTGRLRRRVGYAKPRRLGYGVHITRIRARGIYAKRTNSRYPYFREGVLSSMPEVEAIFYRNYKNAIVRAL